MFRAILVVLMAVLVGAAMADTVPGRVYTGPGGSYTPAPGEVVKELANAQLQITRSDGSTFVVDLGPVQPVVIVPPAGNTLVYRNQHSVGYGSTVYLSPADQVKLRQQDLKEAQTLQKMQREAAEDKHERRMDYADQAKDILRDQQRAAEDKADREEDRRRDEQRARERARDDAADALDDFRDNMEDRREDAADRIEKWVSARESNNSRRNTSIRSHRR